MSEIKKLKKLVYARKCQPVLLNKRLPSDQSKTVLAKYQHNRHCHKRGPTLKKFLFKS